MITHRKISRGPLMLMAVFALLTAVIIAVCYGQFDYVEVCSVCGRARDSLDWQIPGTQKTYYSVREERPSSLSEWLEKNEFVELHPHRWKFVSGHGNGQTIVLGSGHPVSWSLLSPEMSGFMETMLHWTERDTTRSWILHLRDPKYSRLCQAMASAYQRQHFESREAWESWLRDFETEHVQLIAQGE